MFIDKDSLFYSYRLNEDEGDNRVAAFYCFAFGVDGHVEMAAVSYLEDYGIIQIFKYMGTAPYSFSSVWATRSTRQFVKENCT